MSTSLSLQPLLSFFCWPINNQKLLWFIYAHELLCIREQKAVSITKKKKKSTAKKKAVRHFFGRTPFSSQVSLPRANAQVSTMIKDMSVVHACFFSSLSDSECKYWSCWFFFVERTSVRCLRSACVRSMQREHILWVY